jgi:hypothetical protein
MSYKTCAQAADVYFVVDGKTYSASSNTVTLVVNSRRR